MIVASLSVALVAAPVDDHRNAATWYQRSFDVVEGLEWQREEPMWAWLRHMDELGNPTVPPTPEVRALMGHVRQSFAYAARGAEQNYSDFALDHSQGWELLLPHLAPMRHVAKLMRVDALVKLHDGDAAGAARRLQTLYGMGEQSGHDGTLISSLVGMAIFSLSEGVIDQGYERGVLGRQDARDLLTSMSRYDRPDPFGVRTALEFERGLFDDWLLGRFGGDGGAEALAEAVGDWSNADLTALKALSPEDFRTDVGRLTEAMDAVIDAFHDGDTERGIATLRAVHEAAERGDYGILAQSGFMSAYDVIYERMHQFEGELAERMALLEAIAGGEIGVEHYANAAYWYHAAIEHIERLDAEARLDVRWIAVGDEPQRAVRALDLPDQASEAIAALDAASRIEPCDFSILRPIRTPIVVTRYMAPLREGIMILLADAAFLRAAGDVATACDRVATALRVAAHLAGDEQMVSSLIAHEGFGATVTPAAALLRDGRIDEARRAALADAFLRFSRHDPFGYTAAIAASRTDVTEWMKPRNEAHTDVIGDLVDRTGADGVLLIEAFRERFFDLARDPSRRPEVDPRRLDGIIDVALIDQTCARAWLSYTWLIGLAEQVLGGDVQRIGDLAGHHRRGLRDYGAAIERLQINPG